MSEYRVHPGLKTREEKEREREKGEEENVVDSGHYLLLASTKGSNAFCLNKLNTTPGFYHYLTVIVVTVGICKEREKFNLQNYTHGFILNYI
jgi:hypothetical protein